MNRIYQVVWSKAKNCYTVVSEIAKRHGKGNRARTCAAAFLAALALTSVMGMSEAQAQTIDADGISNGDARIALNGAAGMVGMVNGKDASIFMYGGNTTINKKVTIDQTGKIIGVAAGAVTAGSTDAVNGGQLHAVAAEASKHSKVVNGSNINVEESEVNGQKIYKVGLNDDVRLGMIETTGSITTKDSISAANGAQLADINVSGNVISNGKAAIALYGDSGIAGMKNGKGASIYMQDGHTSINEKVNIDQNGKITGVAAGAVTAGSTDAVNGSQLHAVATEAGKHSKVVNGSNINVEESEVNGQKIYKVGLNDDVRLGTIETTGSIATKDRISADKGAQLADINVSGNIISNGAAKIALNDSLGMAAMVNGKGASIFMQDGNTVINRKVAIDKEGNITGTNAVNANVVNANTLNAKYNLNVGEMAENGYMPFFVDSNGAFHAAAKKFSVDKDGKVTATAGEIGNVVLQNGKVTATEGEIGGVTINKGMISNGEAKIALYGDSGIAGMMNGKGASIYMQDGNTVINRKVNIDKDGKVTATAGEIGNVVLQNGKVTAAAGEIGGVTIKEGNITGVNAINTSAINTNVLNSKYNLSVGTANENGTMPFFVNSTGDFYAANNKFSVGKDGKVTATAGEIGGVTINHGISYKNTSLRDGSLFVGDDQGNYSQISPEYAKLGKVTIDKEGNVTGVKSINTNAINANAINAKYNLSVGTANENGTMPFFVNSTGDFYAANNKFSVGKDGKVTATAGEIGGVTINKGIFYKNTALRDGELFVGDASGNYSQITTKGAKLGKVTVAEDGKISGVAAGAITAGSTDAVNGSQLHAVATEAAKHSKVVNGSNINVEESEVNGQKIYKVGLNDDVFLGKLTGNNVSISGTNGTIETTGYIATKDRIIADKGAQLAGINVSGNIISNGAARIALYGDSGVAGMMNGKGASIYMQDGNTVINSKVAIDKDGKITGVAAGAVTAGSTDAVNGGQLHAVAADVAQNKADIAQNKADIAQNKADIAQNKADIAQNKADIAQNKADIAQNKTDIAQNKADIGKLDNRVTNVENLAKQHTTVEAGNNITVTESTNTDGGKKYTVGMAKDITVDSVKVGDKTYVSKDGLNANNQTITNVKDGKIEEGSKDAVNGGQLYATNQLVKDNASNISLLGNSINKLDNRVDKVGAGAAALAALHPLDFDPEDKWDFAAGYGNYSGASAVALGAYYRPNEDTMFSVGGSFGNGENMVNAGVSLKLGQSSHAPASKAAMEKKISTLSQEVEELKAAIADLRAAQTKAKDATEKDAQKK